MIELFHFPVFSRALAEHLHQSPPAFLYHYTSQDGLLGITTSRSLWATNISYMNDATEFDLSLNLIRNHLFAEFQRRGHPLPTGQITEESDRLSLVWAAANKIIGTSIFVTCLCESGDLLSQWRGYAGAGYGYSLGFNTSPLEKMASNSGFILGKCIYDPILQEEIIRQTIDRILNDPNQEPTVHRFAIALKYGAFFKNASFSEEQEWRLIFFSPDKPAPIQFRKGKSMIIPHTSIPIDTGAAIDHVCVGSCPRMELSQRSVEYLLIHNNVTPTVYPSSIPFRDW